MAHSANRSRDRTHVLFVKLTYQQWMDLAQRFAGWLQHKAGVGRMHRVALYMQNCPQWLIAYANASRADAVVVPVSPMYGVDPIRTVLRDAGLGLPAPAIWRTLRLPPRRRPTSKLLLHYRIR
ncbi:AMP-binding protein [Candidatus Skiveiella danica]|uniref:AMP-binding protein n=1 Tax=Candidatus Skiveiella danica TaxID=3386177 RepID=UPI0039B82831